MSWLFWISAFLIIYAYAGFPLAMWLRARFFSKAVHRGPADVRITILIAAHNEARILPAKLANLKTVASSLAAEIIVVSDGSTDATDALIEGHGDDRVRLLRLPRRSGKAAAINFGVREASGEIVLFTDARQIIEPGAIEKLLSNFADATVGCVSGELRIGRPDDLQSLGGEAAKVAVENKIRQWESAAGSMIGALGAFYAARKALVPEMPAGTLLDDMFIPLHIIKKGYRSVMEPGAIAWDDLRPTVRREFQRKVRTLTGNYQLIQLAPWLLGPSNPVWFEYFGHKVTRLISPFALICLLAASMSLSSSSPFYRAALWLQIVGYALAAIGTLNLKLPIIRPLVNFASTFVVLNLASGMGFVNFLRARNNVWVRS